MDDSDSDLIGRFAEQHDQEAFAVLVVRHSPLVLGACRRVLADLHDAEDATQAAFLVLARHASRLDRRLPLGPWLYRVALNLARNALRDRRTRERAHREAAAVPRPGIPAATFDNEIDAALASLPERERSAITLVHLQGRPAEEVAKLVGRPVGTIYVWLSRGRERLRLQLLRRGVGVSAAVLLSALAGLSAGEVPASFAAATAGAAAAFLNSTAAGAGGAATSAAAIASQGIKTMGMISAIKTSLIAAGLVATLGAAGWIAAAEGGAAAKKGGDLLGAPGFKPTPERPLGWRGDGSGRYPGATPPLEWSIGKDRTGKNVAWVTQLPMYHGGTGASQPIVVGDRVYFSVGALQATKGPVDLYCLSLNSGQILTITALTPYDAATAEDRKKAADTVEPMMAEMKRLDQQLIAALNGRKLDQDKDQWGGSWRENVNGRRQDLGNKITAAMVALDGKYKLGVDRQDWGYASTTPCCDGTHIYLWFANRIAACLDLDGKVVWANMESRPMKGGAEHGCHSSPLLLPDRMVVMLGNVAQAFDKKTGKLLWAQEVESTWGFSYSSMNSLRLADGYVVLTAMGQGLRADTGAPLWGKYSGYKGENTTPVVEGGTLVGYECSGIYAVPLPTSSAGGTLKASASFKPAKEEYQIASPLVFDGLVYCVNETALLRVFDPAGNGTIVYEQQLDLKGAHGWVGAPGLAPSPAIGGGNLYVMDDTGTVVVLQPGRTYKQLAKNENAVGDALVTTPVFSGKHVLLRGQRNIYCFAAP